MNTIPSGEFIRATNVWFDRGKIFLLLADGREVGCPMTFYPRLAHATPEELAGWEMALDGSALYWPRLDEDLSIEGILNGTRPPSPGKKVMEEYAPLVLAARKAAGLSQAALAERMEYSQTYVSLAERGKTPFSRFYVQEVLKACGLPEDWKK